jgi:glycosyltransferase involved in cell wall biosynthesis/SAM-dependent methyltransferase
MSAFLVVAHSSGQGGAEAALQRLLMSLRALGHQPVVLLPAGEGAFADWCRQQQFEGLVLPMQQALPDAATAFLQLSLQGLEGIAEQLRPRGFAAVITNTAVMLQGMRFAELLGLPHIAWVHELVDDASEVRSRGVPSADYLRVIGAGADHLLCCSQAVQARLQACGVETPSSVLYPYTHAPVAEPGLQGSTLELLAIGVQSIRKNPVFALTVVQALRLRGHDAVLHIVGSPATQTPRLHAAIQRRGLVAAVRLHGPAPDPYALVSGRAVNLIGASSEPFGLTIPESLARAIPVVASRCGGPQELLDEADLFEVGDIDACVLRIEAIAADYAAARERARHRQAELLPQFEAQAQQRTLADAIAQAQARHRAVPRAPSRHYGAALRDAVRLTGLPRERLLLNIAQVAGLPLAEVEQRVALDQREPGRAVLDDCRQFDVVPFGMSPRMDNLYRDGVGFAIELAATHADEGRLLMAAFIIARLLSEAARRPLRVLALGDGIGIDSLRLASMGFDVDYIDFDGSLTARIARQNFESFFQAAPAGAGRVTVIADAATQPAYDAIVCLEVVEHVSDPHGFLQMLADRLAPGGLLFISECFDGVRDHWPTHLLSNEDYSGLLPLMACELGLALDDFNASPFGKPYVLRKSALGDAANLGRRFRDDKGLLRASFGAQLQLGA